MSDSALHIDAGSNVVFFFAALCESFAVFAVIFLFSAASQIRP